MKHTRQRLQNTKFAIFLLGFCCFFLTTGHSAEFMSFEDCRQIQDTQARYSCYDQLEQANEEIADERLPVLRVPQPVGTTTPPALEPSTEPMPVSEDHEKVETMDRVEQDKKPFYSRIWPFGGEDENTMEEESPEADDETEQVAADPDSFGRGDSQSAKVVENEKGEQELRDTVASFRFYVSNKLEITLESGQVWRQADSKPFMLKAGDTVRIYSAFWGDNYRLSNDRLKSFIQVRRID